MTFGVLSCSSESTDVVTSQNSANVTASSYTTKLFAKVGRPGNPEGIAIKDGRVYVSTHLPQSGNSSDPSPSKIFVYDLESASLLDEISIKGQKLNANHGLLAMTFGTDGMLYAIDQNPPRILQIDLQNRTQSDFAVIPDLKPCLLSRPPCSPTIEDAAAYPDYLIFDPAGNLYVTDLTAATIFKIPVSFGSAERKAEVWLQDIRFESPLGLNGMVITPDGKEMLFVLTAAAPLGGQTLASGVIYQLELKDKPTVNDLKKFYEYPIGSAPDGLALGRSGDLYVVLAGSNQISILGAHGKEKARFPSSKENSLQEVRYDSPASVVLDGLGNILVTNQSFVNNNPNNWAVLKAFVGDLPLE